MVEEGNVLDDVTSAYRQVVFLTSAVKTLPYAFFHNSYGELKIGIKKYNKIPVSKIVKKKTV